MRSVPEGRGLIDVLLGRPKEDFYIPRTWPDDWPDYGIGGSSPSRLKDEVGMDVNQTKSEVVKEHQDQILLDKISGRNKKTNENTSRGEENHLGYGIRPLPRRHTSKSKGTSDPSYSNESRDPDEIRINSSDATAALVLLAPVISEHC